ncbi:hypothetical protein FBEOM_6479 [Fusarium beomiforme]|uniref:Uncharacterized protein n=1 Tax=Fusarium beomiforme TaxID=44412 RepID=A0A9P5AJ14_9HYPO|nr:hypothetical protein FBEOM_6479 [Fusarium beomiforme]
MVVQSKQNTYNISSHRNIHESLSHVCALQAWRIRTGHPLSHLQRPFRKSSPSKRSPRPSASLAICPSPPDSDERRRASTSAVDELPRYLSELKRKCETYGNGLQLTSFHLSKDDFKDLRYKLEETFQTMCFDYDA